MKCSNKIKLILGFLLLASFANSNELKTNVTTIDAKETNNIFIGSETFIVPTLSEFTRVDNNQESIDFLRKHIPKPSNFNSNDIEKLILFEKKDRNTRTFIEVIVPKALANAYITKNEFKAFRKTSIQAGKILNNMIKDTKYVKGYLKKAYNGKVVEMSQIDNGVINQDSITNLSSSYLVSISPGAFSRVNDTLLFLNLKQKIMTITVSNISNSSFNNSRTFELAKEFAAQFIALNEGRMRITTSKPPKTIPSQSKKSKEGSIGQYLEELNKAKELLDLKIINKKEFETIKQKTINKF